MRRRGLLTGLVGSAAALAGCVSAPGNDADGASPPEPVPRDEFERSLPHRDAIAAVTEPAFGDDWSGLAFEVPDRTMGLTTIRPRLVGSDRVIGVERGGEARAYPLRVLNWHEVVNDRFGGPLLVTYCPLCRSAIVARRTVRGEPATFGVSEYLWRSNLVLYDGPTGSLWSQLAARAVRGPLVGTALELVPATITTWAGWRREHPATKVLLPPPLSDTVTGGGGPRNYNVDPYGRYASDDAVPGGFDRADGPHPKSLVIGVTNGSTARAYPLADVLAAGVVNDRVGALAVAVTTTADGRLVAYDRTVDGEVLRFTADGRRHLTAGGSRFRRETGVAIDGPLAGATLRRANRAPPMFWFAWARFHPGGTVFDGSGRSLGRSPSGRTSGATRTGVG